MKATLLVAALVSLAPSMGAAQVVSAEVVIHQGPVAARVVVGPRYPVYYPARVIVVERVRGHGHAKHHPRYRPYTAWYDPQANRYYDRYDGRPGIREVVVYRCDDRYYRYDDDRHSRYDDERHSRYDD
jgi:hypothetical protein